MWLVVLVVVVVAPTRQVRLAWVVMFVIQFSRIFVVVVISVILRAPFDATVTVRRVGCYGYR